MATKYEGLHRTATEGGAPRSRRPRASGIAVAALLGTAGWGLSASALSTTAVTAVSDQAAPSVSGTVFADERVVAQQEKVQVEAEQVIAADRAAAAAQATQRAAAAAQASRDKQRKAFISNAKKDPQSAAKAMLGVYGWSAPQMPCLVTLWRGESKWHWNAANRSSGAYGIPQALPGSKMASAGADWRTNPVTQIRWGMTYVKRVYGSPCAALSRWNSRYPHWY